MTFSLFFVLVVVEVASLLGVLYAAAPSTRRDKIATPLVIWLIVWFGVIMYASYQASMSHAGSWLPLQAAIAACMHVGGIFVGAKLTK